MLKVNEIYYSIQGESTHVGRPCIFIRLTECHLRCTYCDTEYAFYEGDDRSLDQILDQIAAFPASWSKSPAASPFCRMGCTG